jgi:site-specific DNA recombinase
MKSEPKSRIYCAIYTRKSTSEGLDQDFTSLDAQRESAESYIASQKSEGWIMLPALYDDGGYTGANTDRPALQKLMSDIKDGGINCVVVYKVDRLSRSLLDFTHLLEFFEKYNVTFVSVTQAFNTNTSMGRLTLNNLLSFAQFEREIISERTKDKMGAARKKGRWVGGIPILGYDLDRINHKLVINPKEAEIVRELFHIYTKEKSLLRTAVILNEKGYRRKAYVTSQGKTMGGQKFQTTTIQYILKNITYTGKIKYVGKIYPGLHEPIISDKMFQRVQEILANNRVRGEKTKVSKNTALLSEILRCKDCSKAMFHTYTMRGKYKYRYYVCQSAQKQGSCPTRSVNAQTIEDAVIDKLRTIAANSTDAQKELKEALIVNSPIWDTLFPQQKHKALKLMLKKVEYSAVDGKLGLTLNHNGIKFLYLLLHPELQKELK